MEQDNTKHSIDEDMKESSKVRLLKIIFLILGIIIGLAAAYCQEPDKVMKAVDAIKVTNYCMDQDYITDGQRTVWVKSYKRWVPNDLKVMQKESPSLLTFLVQVIQHNRYDALEQLLPDYYRTHGGTKVFAAAILKEQQTKTASSN